MSKRVIHGLERALHVASAVPPTCRNDDENNYFKYDLYRNEVGAFFIIETLISKDRDATIANTHPVTYDQAHSFAKGEHISLCSGLFLQDLHTELLAEGIFPTIPEASEALRREGVNGRRVEPTDPAPLAP